MTEKMMSSSDFATSPMVPKIFRQISRHSSLADMVLLNKKSSIEERRNEGGVSRKRLSLQSIELNSDSGDESSADNDDSE